MKPTVLALLLAASVLAPSFVLADADTTPPEIISVTLTTQKTDRAGAGDTLTLTVEANEEVDLSVIEINAQSVQIDSWYVNKLKHYPQHIVGLDDPEGLATYSFKYTDLAGNLGNGGNPVTGTSSIIVDLTAPVLSSVADVSVEATGPDGAVVSYTQPTALDDNDGARDVVCTPASGTTFELGETEVSCTASDVAGNDATETFTVTVVDTTAPVMTLLGEAPAAVRKGKEYVDAGATATDIVDSAVEVVLSGEVDTGTAGTYTLTYTATDAAGNAGTATREVQVTEASVSGGGGGGGGGGSSSRTSRTQSRGEVLGASTYSFTREMSLGSSGADVRALQEFLIGAGYLSTEVTGYYGPETEAAVRAYQSANGLPNVGRVGPMTLALLNQGTVGQLSTATLSAAPTAAAPSSYPGPLMRGDSGARVVELQERLRKLGHFSAESTGYFGPVTEAAVSAFQAAHDLPVVGMMGPRTYALLVELAP